jgi:tRNA-2-methylthio-N6-dimethylallyladenosine synthase
VHVATGGAAITPGDIVTSTVTYAAPHHLVADGGIRDHRVWHAAGAAAGHAAPTQLLRIGTRPID